jgi:hypothetical protein
MSTTKPGPWKRTKTAMRHALGPSITGTLERVNEELSIRWNRLARTVRELGQEAPDFTPAIPYRVPGRQTWFGYYDVTPFDLGSERLLAMAGPRVTRSPERGESIDVGVFEVDQPERFRALGQTETWCWQQGCRLRWLTLGQRELIIYNKLVHGVPGAVLQDPESGEFITQFTTPLYDIDAMGRYALTLNFARLQRLRPGYGYVLENDSTAGSPAPDDDGVWLFDFSSGRRTLLVSLASLAAGMDRERSDGVEHYVNHLSFNPAGDRFVFLHIVTGTGMRRPRLLVMDRSGGEARLLEEEGSASHFTWMDDRTLLVTVNFSDGRCEYRSYDTETGMKSRFGVNGLDRDGHPSFARGGKLLLTDTYPDTCGDQELLLFGESGHKVTLGRYYSPGKFRGEWRCDLHPRFSPGGHQVAFDATPDGWRALYVLEVPQGD